MYGALSNSAFRYYNIGIAEGITSTGQFVIQHISNRISAFLNDMFKTKGVDYVVFSDTDSIGVNLCHFVEHVLKVPRNQWNNKMDGIVDCLDKFANDKITPFLDAEYNILAQRLGSVNNTLKMKRENIADVALFRKKKNYIMQVRDSEGARFDLDKPWLKAMGVEIARSSTPSVVREALKEHLKIVLNGNNDELIEAIDKFRVMFYNLPLSAVASPRGVTDMDKWRDSKSLYKKGAPIHVKAALHFNDLLLQKNLAHKVQMIRNGNKIKFIYLKEPNPIHCTAIGFVDELPHEFGLDKYVDYTEQFNKTYLGPITSFTSIIGWQTEHRQTLDDLWS